MYWRYKRHHVMRRGIVAVRRFFWTLKYRPEDPSKEYEFYRYRTEAGHPLRLDECPCDAWFVDYMTSREIRNKSIFHLGTGLHHAVGLGSHLNKLDNHILGITTNVREHARYLKLIIEHRELEKNYKVLLTDLYCLHDGCLPRFDVATLFHLCEFPPENYGRRSLVWHDDASVLALLIRHVNVAGTVLFYDGSRAWREARRLVEDAVRRGDLAQRDQYQGLLVYGKTRL